MKEKMHNSICSSCAFQVVEYKYSERYRKFMNFYFCKKKYSYVKVVKNRCNLFRDVSVPDIGKMFNKYNE